MIAMIAMMMMITTTMKKMMMIRGSAGTDCRLLVTISEFGSGQHLLHTLFILITNIIITIIIIITITIIIIIIIIITINGPSTFSTKRFQRSLRIPKIRQ